MTLQQLHYFISIAETGSFNEAAKTLYISQPSLTSSIQELERELGFSLFHRGNRGVSLTSDGLEFISYARQVYYPYQLLQEKYDRGGKRKKRFGISTQHYSFAVKSFVELVKQFGMDEYEFAIRETKTRVIIDDVRTGKSEIGILYRSAFNRRFLMGLLQSNDLVFHPLVVCRPYVYLWKGHPLADCAAIRREQLAPYSCLSFEQGSEGSFYLAEEVLSREDYPRTIKATDRATMLNLMVGLNGYTLCSGLICQELNGGDYAAVPFEYDGTDAVMEIGYILRRSLILSTIGQQYVEEIQKYLARA